MTLSLSKRTNTIAQADIRTMTIECEKVHGLNFAQGVCDIGVPVPVAAGAKGAIDSGVNSYTRYDGLAALRLAIADKMRRFNSIEANPETDIVVSAGSTGSFYCTCMALLDPGDEVILFEPYYGYHVNTLLAVGAVPKYVTTRAPDWSFSPEDLENAVSARTKGIMVCTPSNPSGKVFSKTELDIVADFSIRHDIFVFTDEIYEYFVYDGLRHISPGSIPSIADRTITISGYSKTFSITGWRIGYSVCDARWAAMIGYVNDLVYVCGPSPLQMGVAAGISNLSGSFYEDLCGDFVAKRDRFCSALGDAGLSPLIPSGSYYVLADANDLPGRDSREKAMYLLDTIGLASVPGRAFFHANDGDDLLRFCFAKTDQEIDEACDRLKRL